MIDLVILAGIGFLWWATAAAYFACLQCEFPEIDDYRADLGMACFIAALMPIGSLLAIFLTGFFQHGFNWKFARCYAKRRQERLRTRPAESQDIEFKPWWIERKKR